MKRFRIRYKKIGYSGYRQEYYKNYKGACRRYFQLKRQKKVGFVNLVVKRWNKEFRAYSLRSLYPKKKEKREKRWTGRLFD